MNFRDITERLKAHGSHSLWLLDGNDQVRRISFAELHRRAEEAVRALAARGVTADMRVGILAENSLEWIVYDLAMLVIGCTSVAFPREVAAESWPELFDRYDLSLMLVAADEKLPLDALRGRVHVIDGPSPSAAPALPPRRARAPEVQAPALIFSSGSTGKAKCMMVNPGGVWFVIDYLRDLYSLNEKDRLLIFLPFSHYQQRGMVYAGIWLGMDLAMVAPQQLFAGFRQLAPTLCVGPPLLYETIYAQFHNRVEKLPAPARQALRALTAVPRRLPEGRLRRRAQRLAYGGIHKALGGAMRAMITGAAPIKRDVLEFFNEAGIGLYEGYGTGETGLITANAMDSNRIGSVGKPPPVGETRLAEDGEIIVGSRDFAATGYLHVDADGERVELFDAQYATGDIGRFDEDGYLYLVGRKREIIITSSGLKIHPEVVEAKLAHHHMVERVAVFGSDMPYLVAVIVPRVKGDAAVEAAIREHAQAVNQTLNVGTQVGRVIFSPESFTYDNGLLTRTLKLDRRGIARRFETELRGAGTGELLPRAGAGGAGAGGERRDGAAAGGAADGTYAAPRTDVERALAGLWSELLGVERIGLHDDFFALGGNSLLALQVASRAQRAGLGLEARLLFDHPTIATLAAALAAAPAPAAGSAEAARRAWPEVAATARVPGRAVPLSLAQQRIWFLQRLDEASSAYNIPVALRLVGPLAVAALERGFQAVVERHEILRTSFPEREGRPVQEIAAAGPIALEVIDLTGLPREAALEEARRRGREEARRPFDLAQGAPWRAQVLRLGAEEHVLLLTLHHVVADGWSIPIFMRELAAGYEHARRGGAGPVPGLAPLAVQYADVAIWQQEVLVPRLAPQVAYWKQALAEAPAALELVTDRPRPAAQSYAGGAVPAIVDEELTAKLEALGRAHKATLFMVLQSAWAVLLARYSGQERVVVGVPVANRTQVALEPLIGMFVNTLVLHNDLRGQPSFAEVLARGRAMVLGAFEHADVPFEQLVEVLQPIRDLSRNPLFQTSFALEYEWTARPTLPGLKVTSLYEVADRTQQVAQFDLSMVLVRTPGGGLEGELGYSAALFERATIERLVRQYRELLRAVVAGPQTPMGALDVSDEAERRELAAWNAAGAAALPAPSCIHDEIAAQAVRTPDAVAVSFGDERLTYAELLRRAGQLAGELRALGVGPDARVGLCVERSLDMVVGMVAILLAGGAYLPLDPSYPRERLTFMLEDAGARVLVTQRHLAGLLAVPGLHTVLLPASEGQSVAALAPLPPTGVTPEHLAYVIYTSGSTGRPKGVMVPHRTVSSFFAAMDRRLGDAQSGVWLAITSISFDISVLELLWTLARGFHVVVHGDEGARRALPRRRRARAAARPLEFSLFYFANDSEQGGEDRYRLLLEGARFADEHGFAAVWTPERHFHAFGGLYPNPSVVSAMLAGATRRIGLRAGSVVMPLHHPVRVAEEWALVDNLSSGRVGVSFASGWHADDFVFAPHAYAHRRELMLEGIDQVRRLWRGERLRFANGVGQAREVEIRPRPIQAELPFWLTAAGNPETFRSAGRLGANVLTHLLGQSAGDLQRNVAIYREAWRAAGHAAGHRGSGHVTLMLHTFVHADAAEVRARVDAPFRRYLESSADLMRGLGRSLGMDVDSISPEDLRRLVDHAFDRYFETSGLFGTPRELRERAAELHELGVDEIGCLVDFGIDTDVVLESLPHLDELRRLVARDGLAAARATVAEQIHRHGVTHLQCTPSFARTLVDDPEAVAALGRLSRLLVGGEALPAPLAGTLCRVVPGGEVLNMYGPTETTIWSSTHRVEARDGDGAGVVSPVVSIGRGIEGTWLHVLDQHRQPVPVGAPGELYIGGTGVVRGYLGRPELTAERFMPDPFRQSADARMYRTGDRVRRRADGTLEFLGRVDHQLKLRGVRIEPGEIEAALESHPGVRQAVVVAREDEPGDVRLVGYVVADAPAPEAAALRGYLQQRLPEAMVPSALVTLAALPLTPNGKVDRQALPAPTLTRGAEAAFVAPQSPLELQLAEVWQQVLGIDRVGVHDDFFSLGGHSMLVLPVVAGARRAGIHLEVRQLFEHPTIAALAAALAPGRDPVEAAGATRHAWPPIVPAERVPGRAVPLSLAQQRIWFLQRFDETSSAYNVPVALRLMGPLDVATLARGFQAVVERHEILRTSFPEREGRPVQEIAAAGPVALDVIDLTGLPREAALAEARRRGREEARRPFELAQGAPWRAQVLRLGAEEHALLLTLHHVVADGGSSIPILMRELAAGYEHARRGGAGPVPGLAPLAVQYADVAIWQQEVLVPRLAPQVAYWKQALAEAPAALALPTDRPRPAVQSHAGGAVPVVVDEELTAKLEALGRAHRTTLFTVLQSAWAVLLGRYSRQDRVMVGVAVANRTQPALEPLIGMFVNTLVLHNDLRGQPSFAEVLERGRAMVLGAFEHADVPFEQLVEVLQPVRDLSRNPLFQASFTMEYEWAARPALPGLEVASLYDSEDPAHQVALFDLSMFLGRVSGAGLSGELGYSAALFERATIERLVRQYRELLRAVVAEPETAVGALGLSDEAERHELAAWNAAGAAALPPPRCIHDEIAAQAVRTPDAVAVSFGDERLTYAELQQRAGQLAHHLRALGVGPDARVGLCVERSLDMVVGMLAILAAGGAYLPLDPSYPRERLTFMLEDAGARVLVTQRHLAGLLAVPGLHTVLLPTSEGEPVAPVAPQPPTGVTPEHLAYVIYTSGSTGRPKGVMVPHRTVSSFFAAMDRRLGDARSGVWLAITSISFDISVLELLWTLARGFHVVVHGDEGARRALPRRRRARAAARPLEFSLFYFANDSEQGGEDRYRLLLEGARFADEHGFAAVWTPERHFHAFGGLYPNPSVAGAALAVMTRRIGIRAGSVVLPLHHPVRITEEWTLVDNLSHGRVGISFASGWHADDFVFAPNAYASRRELMLEGIDQVRRLWRGERLRFENGVGESREVEIRPRPIQAELPFWLTAAGNPETFRSAGRLGANVLTHLLGQSAEDLQRNIAIYREAWREAGHAAGRAAGHRGSGHVTLMLHTFVHADAAEVRARVDAPFRSYLASSADLMRNLGRSLGVDVDAVSPDDLRRLIDHAFDRYFGTSGLFGTPREMRERAAELHELGVDEIGCLIDFGIDPEIVLASLPHLDELRRLVERDGLATDHATVAEQIHRHGVTHLQCTPSFARTLVAEPASVAALGQLSRLLVGGEALPAALASALCEAVPDGEVLNMYGPTETTIWSSTHRVQRDELAGPVVSPVVSIGRGIDGTWLYVLDEHRQPVPVGAPGELYIGGLGVVRGYLGRPELTAERFVSDPFRPAIDARMYRTGDRVRWRADGTLEFLGREDHQLKVRGVRIEPGEIEAALESHPGIRQAVVVAREDEPGDVRLVGYVVADAPAPEAAALRGYLQQRLPEAMVPSALVTLAALPLTPNGKVNRQALPAPTLTRGAEAAFVAPQSPLELQLAAIWQQVLGIDRVGVHDDFFSLGGHSLLVLQVVSGVRRAGLHLEVRQLFEHPTIAALAAALASAPASVADAQAPAPAAPHGEDDLPLSPNQRWFTETFDAEHDPWARTVVWQATPGMALDLARLRAAAARVIAHHDVLRMRLYRTEQGWAQRLEPTADAPLEEHDLGALSPAERRRAILQVARELQERLSIVRGPVLGFAVCRMGGEPDQLIISIHHTVYDDYSLELLVGDFLLAYAQLDAGQEPELPPVPTPYRQYLRALASYGGSPAMEQERAFWLDAARLRPVPALPADLPGGRHTDRNSRRHSVLLAADLIDDIQAWLAAHPEVHLNELLLFGLARSYARWSGAEALRLDIEHNGRTVVLPGVDLVRTVGPITLKVPVLFELQPEAPPAQAFRQIQRTLRDTIDHGLGFSLLRYGQAPAARDLHDPPDPPDPLVAVGSPQVFFNNRGLIMRRAPEPQGAFEFVAIPRADGGENLVSYDLMVECDNTPEGPTVSWVYSSALHRPQTIEALADGTFEQIRQLVRSSVSGRPAA